MKLLNLASCRNLAAAALLSALTAALLAVGCSNTSVRPEEAQNDPYPARSCPDSVLAKLTRAYIAMDAEAYLDCMADTLSFWLLRDDWSNPDNPLPHCWGKGVEDTIHSRMFGDATNVDRVQLTMYTETYQFVAGPDTTDPYDDRWVYEQDVDLRVVAGDFTFWANADQLFTFARQPGRSDTLWWIVEWHEVDPWGRVEDSSWGSIKALFR